MIKTTFPMVRIFSCSFWHNGKDCICIIVKKVLLLVQQNDGVLNGLLGFRQSSSKTSQKHLWIKYLFPTQFPRILKPKLHRIPMTPSQLDVWGAKIATYFGYGGEGYCNFQLITIVSNEHLLQLKYLFFLLMLLS